MAHLPLPLADLNVPLQNDPKTTVVRTPDGQVTVTQPDGGVTVTQSGPPTAAQMLEAAKAYRDALKDQWDELRSTRSSVASATRDDNRTATDISGLELRLKAMDERLLSLEKQIAVADAKVADASAVPGAVVKELPRQRDNRPDWDSVFAGGAILTFALLFPFAIAYSRRIWRKSAKMTVTLPPDVATRMQAMEEAIESVAIEVERIGEGQRFVTQALAEQPRFVGAGAAEPVMVRPREPRLAERPL